MRTDNAPVVRLDEYRPPDYLIQTVDLDIRLAPRASRVVARLALGRREGVAPETPLRLDGDGLVLERVEVDGRPVDPAVYLATPDSLTIHAPPVGPFELTVTTVVDPEANSALMGLYRSNGVYTTQCEAEGFRRITYFLDRPDVLSVYTTRIEAVRDEAPILLGNGNPVEQGEVPGTDRHYAVWHDPHPKPCYLFALVAGRLASIQDGFTTCTGRQVRLAIHCEPGKEERCRYAMEALKRSMRWDEERFGREYDLDVFNVVAVSDFNMGAMENKGLNIFNDKYVLVDPDSGTDADYANVEAVIAHEYFHNWTGNRITCRDWFQLCLKEGLTVFRDQEFSADMSSPVVERIANVTGLRQQQFPEDAGPLAHPVRPAAYREINNFYTATVYEKGAEICRMLQTLLGRDGFRAGMDLYFDRHDGEAATIEDFLAAFQDPTGTDLSQFALWYSQAGTPTVTLAHRYDAEAERMTLTLKQEMPETPDRLPKSPMLIPLAFGFVGSDGQDVSYGTATGAPVANGVIRLGTAQAEVVFEKLKVPAIPSLLRAFSAPVHLNSDLTTEERLFLVGHDADPFNRWEAAQRIALGILEQATAAIRGGSRPVFDGRFGEALRRLAEDDALDPAFRALALALPGESEIAQAIGRDIDPDAVHAARRALQAHLGATIGAAVRAAVERCPADRVYSPDADQAGRRALAHAAWALGVACGALSGEAVAAIGHDAENLTDRLTALRLSVHFGLPGHDGMLSAFYRRYSDNALVLDKWLAVQATVPAHSTLAKVEALTRHPTYSMKNPNRVYALIRSFATANPVGFNRPDGTGYRYVAKVLTELDEHNPSVAARLATAFRSYRMLEPARRAQAEAVLRNMQDRSGLSRDVRDILTRTLQG